MISLSHFLPSTLAPEDERKRGVLVLIIVLLLIPATLGILTSLFWGGVVWRDLPAFLTSSEGLGLLSVTGFWIVLVGLLIALRSAKIPTWLPGAIFVGALVIGLAFSDTAEELANGRSLLFFVIPIILSAAMLTPAAAFATAIVVSGEIWVLANIAGVEPNIYAMAGYLAIAGIAWLATSSLEKAVKVARAEASRNQAILDAIADGVMVMPAEGGDLELNPAAAAMLSDDERAQIAQTRENTTLEINHRSLSVMYANVPSVGHLFVVRDESRRREIERMKDSLLGTISHEMRTPLSAILGFSEMIASSAESELIRKKANSINIGGRRLYHLIKNMLDRAQIEAGALILSSAPYSPEKVVQESLMFVSEDARRKGITINIASSVPDQVGDPERFGQIVTNLVTNAVKFTSSGGTITILMGVEDEDWWNLVVSDTGAGIPPAQLPDIFEPFRRASNYEIRVTQGAGLGLSITKGLVTAMGGRISVASVVGQGSAFTVRLPRKDTTK